MYLPSGVTALHLAAAQGNLSMITLLLRAHVSREGQRDRRGGPEGEAWGGHGHSGEDSQARSGACTCAFLRSASQGEATWHLTPPVSFLSMRSGRLPHNCIHTIHPSPHTTSPRLHPHSSPHSLSPHLRLTPTSSLFSLTPPSVPPLQFESTADMLPGMLMTLERQRRRQLHPDPRLMLTRSGRLPYHIAVQYGQRAVLEWLDPSTPLMFLLAGSDGLVAGTGGEQISLSGGGGGGALAVVGVPRLTVVAANALHAKLMAELGLAEVEMEALERRWEEERREREELKREAHKQAKRLPAQLVSRLGSILSSSLSRRSA